MDNRRKGDLEVLFQIRIILMRKSKRENFKEFYLNRKIGVAKRSKSKDIIIL